MRLAGPVWPGIAAIGLAGCLAAQQTPGQQQGALLQKQEREAAQRAGENPGQANLAYCVAPVVKQDGTSYRMDVNYARYGMKYAPALTATTGCDVMISIATQVGGAAFHYEASSALSSSVLASGEISNWWGANKAISELQWKLTVAFAPGTPAYDGIMLERRKATGVAERTLVFASPERQQQIDQAAQEGDAAMAAGDTRKAFAAYTRALSGPYSDDATSHAVRGRYMPLIAQHPQYLPQVPEEARMHMVRAKAILKDSQEFAAYDEAGGEMAAAIGAAPWWTDAYYNIALVAEKAGYVSSAIGALQLYLAANPHAADARAVQDKIYALQVKLERSNRR